jgi:putative chitobiose transport system substrate-binding protein
LAPWRPKDSAGGPSAGGPAVAIAIAIAVILSVFAGGPGPIGEPAAPRAGSADAAGQVTLEFWTISLQPFFTKFINGLIDGYQRAHPGIRIRWIDVQPQALDQKLLSSIAGGVAPDVVNLNTETTLRLAEVHALLDMDAAVPAGDKARYFP